MYDLPSQVFSIGVLVASAFVLSSIDKVDDYIDDFNDELNYQYHYRYGYRRHGNTDLEYENANSYRIAAQWMICVASLGIIFHPTMLLFRYVCCRVHVRSLFAVYSYVVSYA